MRKRKPKPGDLLRVVRSDNRVIVGHYLAYDSFSLGPLVCFYECAKEWNPELGLADCHAMFPPVYCGTDIAVRTGVWEIVGYITPPEKIERRFLDGGVMMPEGGREPWCLVEDGIRTVVFGEEAPEWAQNLEMYLGWSAATLGDRFDTGRNLYSYDNWMSENPLAYWQLLGLPDPRQR